MADAQAITGYVATVTGLGTQVGGTFYSAFAPQWIVVKLVLFLISTGITVFNTYTDWRVVLNYKEFGFNNPLLPLDVHWLQAWFLFAAVGTILAVISVFQDCLSLLYSMYKSCRKYCCKPASTGQYQLDDLMNNLGENLIPVNETGEETAKKDEDDEIDDPCRPCYHCGCNAKTRKESLNAISLWFQDVPMLTMAVLYAYSQTTCKTPETRDVAPVLRDIGISATAATISAFWKLIISFTHLYSSVGVRMECNHSIKKCLPKKGDAAYPPDTRAQFCIFPFFFGLIMQFSAIVMATTITGVIWSQLAFLQPNFDDSLGIYRFSVDYPDVRLFNISGTIIPPNGSFVNLEQIPSRELSANQDVFCLSEFEYRIEESQIFFNAIELVVVSEDGRFCANYSGPTDSNFCRVHYTFLNFVLYYASVDTTTGEVVHFDQECTAIKDMFDYDAGPFTDFNIDVSKRVDFPVNGGPLLVFYPAPVNIYVSVPGILNAADRNLQIYHTFQDFETSANVTCSVKFVYDDGRRQIAFGYRDIYALGAGCICSLSFLPGPNCDQFHQNLVYAYLTEDNYAVPYTHCSEIPQEKLVPYYSSSVIADCPCSS